MNLVGKINKSYESAVQEPHFLYTYIFIKNDDRGTAALKLFKTKVKVWLTGNSRTQFASAGRCRKCTE